MKYKLLRFSLLCILTMLCGGEIMADTKWVLTDPTALETGDVVAIVNKANSRALGASDGVTSAPEVTLSTDANKSEITSEVATSMQWTVTVGTSGTDRTYQFGTGESFLYVTATNDGVKIGTGNRNTFTVVTGGNNNGYYLYNKDGDDARYVGAYATSNWRCYTSITNNIKVNNNAFYKKVEAAADTRVETTIEFAEGYQTWGMPMQQANLPTATVKTADGATTISDAEITWTSSNEDVATIAGNMLVYFKTNGKATITATYAGDETQYKGCTKSYEITVHGATYDGEFNFGDYNDYGSGLTPDNNSSSYITEEKTWTAGSITLTTSGKYRWWTDGTLRLFTNIVEEVQTTKIVLAAPTGKVISQIAFTGKNLTGMEPDAGTLSNGTWTGSANSVTFTWIGSSNPQISSIKVSYQSEDAPEAPTFVTDASTTYYGSTEVTLSTTTEGATIYYTFNESPDLYQYEGPITLNETTTIHAYAQKDDAKSATVSATYTIRPLYTTVAQLHENVTDDYTPIGFQPESATVVFVNDKNGYLVDNRGYGVLVYNGGGLKVNSETDLAAGQVLTGGMIRGSLVLYDGSTEISGFTTEGATISTAEVTPAEKTLPLTSANQSTLVTLKGLTYTAEGTTLSDGTNTITYYDKFKTNATLEDGKKYDVTGIVVMFNDKIEICPRTATDVVEATSEEQTGFRDIKVTLNDASMWQNKINSSGAASTVYITVDAEGNIGTTENAEEAAATLKGYWHGAQYGWQKFSAEVPVEGCVKITLGASNYGSGAVIVTNSDGDQVAKIDNHTGAMWSTSNPDNVAVGYYRTNSPTTLTFSQCDYIPYFAVEAIDEADLPAEVAKVTVTYEAGEGTGVAPAAVEVEMGKSTTAPINTSLYKDGYTLTGWTEVATWTEYAPGAEFTPTMDMDLTAQYTQNEVSLADRTEAVTVTWALGEKNGVEGVEYNGTTGIIVTQATVGESTIDAKLDVDATSGKFTNKNRNDAWAMINANTKLTVPACKNAVIKLTAYQTGYSITAGGNAMTDNGDKTYTYTVTDDVTSIDIVNAAQVYLSHVAVTLPKVEEGGDEPAATDVTATWDFKNVNPSTLSTLSIQKDQTGTVASNVEGIELYVIANAGKLQQRSSDAQFNNGTVIQVPVKNKGDQVVVVSYPNYHYYTIGGINAAADTETYEAKQSDATNGYVEIVSTGSAYLYSITVTQYAPKEATTLDNEPATATFPFNLGTAGQTATFSEGDADYFLNSKVELGANMGYAATRTLGDYTFTKIQPQTANASAAAEDYVLFRIQPKPGFTFTPSAASLVAYKDGTGNGTLTIAFVTADGTETTLATGQAIARNSETPAYTSLTYNDLSAVTPVEGVVGLKVYIGGNLATNKQVGLSNIIIEGTLSGTEKDLPILASFKANGTEYTVDEVFGDLYEADLELSKSESMISESNPLTEITAASGEVGTVIYTNSSETACTVTIPVTAGETTLEYILNIAQKPDFTLTYIDVDGTTVLNTQTVEKDATIGTFAQDIADVAASKDGYKARGWFKNNYVGEKWATTDVVTADANLYAVETEIEVASLSKKYVFDLTDKNFDPADHEAFNPTGGKPNVSDMRHGWAFANGNTIDLLVGPKASIIISTCQYPTNGTTKITASNGQSIDAVSATDGATATIEYEGEAGTLTLSFDGSAYIHKLTILNTAETNYEKDGDWIIAKAGDASSLLDAIDAANGTSGEDPVYIFLPNGTYDLAQTTKTNIGRSNVSIIGESMEGVIIKNRPVKEGIDITATLQNNSENLYMQDLTLDCVAPYGTGDDTSSAERGVTLQDQGTKTICKNVYLKGLQDTYYCNNNDGQYYFEDGKIEGTVDYICGHGDAYFNKVALFNAKRTHGNSGDVIAAPNTPKQHGYIFNECTIDGVDGQDGQYALGRPWASNTQVIFLNTTMKIQPKAEGWSEWSTDVAKQNSVKQFAEYKSVDANGNAVDTSNRKTTFKGVENVPTLNETQAAAFALETVFAGWDPAQYTEQVKTTSAKLNGNTLTWAAVDGATMYAIVKNGSIIDLTDQTSYTIADEAQGAKGLGTATDDPTAAGDTYAVRAANGRGGFGEAVVADDATGIDNITTDATGINGTITEVYSMGGARLAAPQKGVNIVKVKANDGSVKTVKVVIK